MPFPTDYWGAYEHETSSLDKFVDAVQKISAYQKLTDSRFVWRGITKADRALHSRLFREYREKHGNQVPTEMQLRGYERTVIDEAHDWGLDWHVAGGHLTALELLAALQHYGAPTRLLDFTFNPFIALWFAAEKHDGIDGRVFAIDIGDRTVSRDNAAKTDPWWFEESSRTDAPWATRPWVWRPPPLEPRIVRQDGCFVMGGVPSTQPRRNLGSARLLKAPEIRSCMSVPLALIKYDHAEAAYNGRRLSGKQPEAAAFTLRVTADKAALRADLDRMFGHNHQSLFPDFPGFAEYGRSSG